MSVSHSGIKLLKTVKSSATAPDYFRVLRPYTYVLVLSLCRFMSQTNTPNIHENTAHNATSNVCTILTNLTVSIWYDRL